MMTSSQEPRDQAQAFKALQDLISWNYKESGIPQAIYSVHGTSPVNYSYVKPIGRI